MGNILIVGNCPKIADFEYAKRVDDDSPMHLGRAVRIEYPVLARTFHSPSTKGTEYFMPIEITSRDFEFTCGSVGEQSAVRETANTPQPSKVGGRLKDLVADKRRSGTPEVVASRPAMTGPVLRHIPLHDLEGFWWVSIILSIWRGVQVVKYATNSQSKAQADSFRRFANDMFTNSDIRRKVLTNNYTFKNATRLLHRYFQVAGSKLENARSVLNKAFRAAESDLTAIKSTVSDSVYSQFICAYEIIALDLVQEGDFDLAPMKWTFLNQHQDSNPPLASLSLYSHTASLGNRMRDDSDIDFGCSLSVDTPANGADVGSSASRTAKRTKRDHEESAVLSS